MIEKGYDFSRLEAAIKSGQKILILNADDMGMSKGVTDGIVRSYREGLITDISMIPSMPDSERAAGLAVEKELNVGVHIDLTRQSKKTKVGKPLMGDQVPSLTDDQGFFHGSGEFRKRMLGGQIDLGEVEAEIRRQVTQAEEWGLDLTHLDSNEGMHNHYPEILRIVLAIARERDLPIRWPNPIYLDWLRKDGILTTDYLNYTFYDVPAEAKKSGFLELLKGFRPGITEFIFHPATPEVDTKSLTAWERREAEMELLIDPEVIQAVEREGIRPISFREIRERQRDMRSRGMGILKAGAARVKITPPFQTQMGGFFDRREMSQGTHDDLFARAISLDDGRNTAILVSVEVLYVDSSLVKDIRAEISRTTGLGEECIMVFATHTHSGPEGHTGLASLLGFFPNPSLREFLVQRIAFCGAMAFSGAREARIGAASVKVADISANRQKEGGPIDDELRVLLVEDRQGKTIGGLVNFTAHPVIMDSRNLLYCSEYPGHAMKDLEGIVGNDSVFLFANGACGNVTIRRKGSSFSEVGRVGRSLAGEAMRALASVDATEEVSIGSSCSSIPLSLRELPTVEQARSDIEEIQGQMTSDPSSAKEMKKRLAKAAGTLALAEKADYIRGFLGEDVTTQLQVFTVNENVLVGVPAELFVEYGLSLIEDLKPQLAFLIGYCNDIVGYVVTPDASEEGGYEAGATLLDDQAGKRIVDGLLGLARGS